MHGARKLVIQKLDELLPLEGPGLKILDVCSGDGEITEYLEKFGDVTSVDFDPRRSKSERHPTFLRDVAYTPWYWAKRNSFDVVTCFYAIQHIWGDEGAVWREIRRALKPGGLFLTTGRFLTTRPKHEPRHDPGRSDDASSLHAMGLAAGLTSLSVETFQYTEMGFAPDYINPNVHFSAFGKGVPSAAWHSAKARYRLLDIDGWMHDDELEWLYQTAAGQAGGTVVEVGSFLGKSSCSILAGLKDGGGGRLACIDTFDGRDTSRHAEMKKLGKDAMLNLHRANTRERGLPDAFYYVGHSAQDSILSTFEREGLDWVFIDGDHNKPAVALDIKNWRTKVARGGILSGHDYHADFPGVKAAVDEAFGSKVENPAGSIWKVVVD